jgi:cardiolipin synthase
MVVDNEISIVGTANMDYRSFDLNFEVNAVVYGAKLAEELRTTFFKDLAHAKQINPDVWRQRPKYKQLPEKVARLLSPLL